MMNLNNLYRICCLCLLCSWCHTLSAQQGNDVIFGKAQLQVDCHLPVDSVKVILNFRNILTETERICDYTISAKETTTLEIPVLLKQTVGYIHVTDDSLSYFTGFVGLHQEVPLKLSLTAVDSLHTESRLEGGMGFNGNDAGNMVKSLVRFMETKEVAPREKYLDWHQYLELEMDSLYARRVIAALKDDPLSTKARTWLTNVMTAYYLGGRIMAYQQDAQQYYQLSVPDPPLDYYGFLQRFKLSRFVMYSDSWGLIVFLRFFLHTPVFDIPPIGEAVIADWMADIKARLTPTVGELPEQFLELLSALSYLQQLEAAEPLTEVQLRHIAAFYKNDLGKFIMGENEQLVKMQDHQRESRVMTLDRDSDTPIMEQILQHYEGRPVVVDFWNTWCAPCMHAHRLVEPIKSQAEFLKVAFVYIADESSSRGRWEGTIPEIRGDHYFLTEKEAKQLKQEYDCEGIPFYLFYDANHELKSTRLGFPGPVDFKHRLRGLL